MKGSGPSAECYFLHIPLEIRKMIYRLLLIPRPRLLLWHQGDSDPPGGNSNLHGVKTAILRTNRLIYFEASELFYSEATIMLRERDITGFGLEKPPPPYRVPWRHDPIHAINDSRPNGECTYITPELTGLLEPHIFWRFQEIELCAFFDFLLEVDLPYLSFRIDSEFNVDKTDIESWQSFLQTKLSTSLRDFVKIVSKSAYVKSLSLELTISMDVTTLPDGIGNLPSTNPYVKAANQKAANLFFMESNIVNPLRSLQNVREFTVSIEGDGLDPKNPEGNAWELACDMKNKIQKNFQLISTNDTSDLTSETGILSVCN